MKTSLLLSASLLLFSTVAFANPVKTLQELHAHWLAGHVKLTYITNYDGDHVTTYGTSQSPWVQASSSVQDLGSGMQSIPIMEMCDCHVPTGASLEYEIVSAHGATVVTVEVSGTDPGLPSTLGDCTTACQLADANAADAGRPDASVPDPGPPAKTKSGGCAFVAPGTSRTLLCLALLGLAIAARRRRP